MLLCEANSAITRLFTPLFAKLVMKVRRVECELAPFIFAFSYKRFSNCVSAFVLKCLLYCVLNRKARCMTFISLFKYLFSAAFALSPTKTRLPSFPFVCSACK